MPSDPGRFASRGVERSRYHGRSDDARKVLTETHRASHTSTKSKPTSLTLKLNYHISRKKENASTSWVVKLGR